MMNYKYNLCDCSLADPCVFGKIGLDTRCNIYDIMERLGCTKEELPTRLAIFRKEEKVRISNRFQKMYPNGIKITLIDEDIPE